MNGFKQTLDSLGVRFNGMSFSQKIILGAVGAATVVCLLVFSMWLQNDEMAVLFTNMSPEDASSALQELAKQDVPTELQNGGTTILVPSAMKDRLRLDLAAKGMPSSGTVGFEVFDSNQYGMTEFLQNVNFKRALEGELTQTIESLQGIRAARVHLSLPKPSMFKRLAAEPTASVVLTLARGNGVAAHQITGIQNLVAGAVENLTAENVTVLDQAGEVLSSTARDDDVGRSETQLALRKEVEGHLAEKASSMLDRVLGPGRSIVKVDATLNFEKIDSQREIYDPASTVVRSEVRTESTVPSSGETSEESTTNYEINKTVEHVVSPTGGLEKLSVAVFVDGNYAADPEGGDPIYTPLGDDDLAMLKRNVELAVGVDASRGDRVEVANMQFQAPPELPAVQGTPLDLVGVVTQYGGKVVLVIMLGVMVLVLRKNLNALLAGGSLTAVGKKSVAAAGARGGASDLEVEAEHFDGIPEFNDQVISDIQDFASENPERVAEVIQSWVHGINPADLAMQARGD
ncbi:flagellar M-ring protein FliF [bacterium CG_4_9_14_3_um_filter_65_15]|nr:MAG: flagellar M-ring protein FliF [Rhodocyclales bacterium CG17_big_fil_post_rev_8_21_14_2_50_68_7]PJA75320.1 MAG: flagellar M-ring protein FliF [bacterium CG_4_9_14_3_um_filter_65_15]